MIDPVLKAFEGLLSDFTWRRVTALLVVTIYAGLIFAAIETVSGHFALARIEHAANILGRLQEIQARQPPLSPELGTIHKDLVRRLRAINNADASVLRPLVGLWKFFAAAAPFLLLSLMFVPGIRKRQPGISSTLLGFCLIAALAGFVGMLIPTFLWPWGNLVVFPITLFVIFGVFAVRWQKRQAKRAAASKLQTA
jgi:Flp pilus assembly protein TadB